MSRRSDKESRNRRNDNYHPIIDDRTGFRISSKDAVEDWGGIITHKKNALGMPQTLILPELPQDELEIKGPVRPDKFIWSSRELYDFEQDIAFNDVAYKTAAGLNVVSLNPEMSLLQSQNPVYWNTVSGTWNAQLSQFVNRTYNNNAQFAPTTYVATFGDDIEPNFLQFQPE